MGYFKIIFQIFVATIITTPLLASEKRQPDEEIADSRERKRPNVEEPLVVFIPPTQLIIAELADLQPWQTEENPRKRRLEESQDDMDALAHLTEEEQTHYHRFLTEIDATERQDIEAVLRKYDIQSLASIISNLTQVAPRDFLNLLLLTDKYCEPSKEKPTFLELLSTFAAIPSSKMEAMLWALENIPETNNVTDRIDTISNLSNLEDGEIKTLVNYTLSYLEKNKWYPPDCHAFIYFVSAAESLLIDEVIERARPVFEAGEGWGGDLVGKVAFSMTKIQPQLIGLVQQYMVGVVQDVGASCANIPLFINNLSAIDPAQLCKVIDLLKQFRQGLNVCDSLGYVTLLAAVKNVQSEQGADLLSLDRHMGNIKRWNSKKFPFLGWTGHLHGLTLKALATVPLDQRLSILHLIQHAQGEDFMEINVVEAFILGLDLIPPSQHPIYIQNAYARLKAIYKEGDFDFETENPYENTEVVVSRYGAQTRARDATQLKELFDYWTSILRGGDVKLAQAMSGTITNNFDSLGLFEGHPFFEDAVRIGAQIWPDPHTSPPFIYSEIKRKKEVPVKWSKVPGQRFKEGNLVVALNPEALARFGTAFQLDTTTVPKITRKEYRELLKELRTKINESSEPQTEEEKAILGHIKTDLSPTSHKSVLINSPADNIQGNKFKCVTSYIKSIEDAETRLVKLRNLLLTVRNCGPGQNTSVDDWYKQLPAQYRMKTIGGEFNIPSSEERALHSLLLAVQEAVSEELATGKLIEDYCCDDDNGEIIHGAHQIQYQHNMIGNLIGLLENIKYDKHANCVCEDLLDMSVQEMLSEFHMGLRFRFLLRIRDSFNRHFLQHKSDVYPSLVKVYENHKARPQVERIFDWMDVHYKDEDDLIGESSISTLGIIRLMQHAGILDELKSN